MKYFTIEQRETLVRLIGYLEGLQYAIVDDGVGTALDYACQTLETLLRETGPCNLGKEA